MKLPSPKDRRARLWVRLAQHLMVTAGVLVVSLAIGIWGYWRFAGLAPLDGFLNASMLLAGMGPVAVLDRPEAKLFAGIYALYCGVVFVATVGFLVTPVLHHLLLSFRVEDVD